jgi:SAM-dependent methyltransferase
MPDTDWDKRFYHGRTNRHPFTDVVSFVMRAFSRVEDRGSVRILDLGCGGAHHLIFLAQEGFDYYGVDGSQESVDSAKSRLSEAGYASGTIAKATFDALPYDGGFFDAVIDRGALTCNPGREIPALLDEAKRTLKPGGLVYSTILNLESTAKDTGTPLGDGDYENCGNRLEDAGILHFTTTEEALRLFAAFDVQQIVKSVNAVEYPEGDGMVVAWNFITARKPA